MSSRVPAYETPRHDLVLLRRGVSDPARYYRDADGHYHALDCRGCEIERLREIELAAVPCLDILAAEGYLDDPEWCAEVVRLRDLLQVTFADRPARSRIEGGNG